MVIKVPGTFCCQNSPWAATCYVADSCDDGMSQLVWHFVSRPSHLLSERIQGCACSRQGRRAGWPLITFCLQNLLNKISRRPNWLLCQGRGAPQTLSRRADASSLIHSLSSFVHIQTVGGIPGIGLARTRGKAYEFSNLPLSSGFLSVPGLLNPYHPLIGANISRPRWP